MSVHPAMRKHVSQPDRIVALENAVKELQCENKELRLHLVGTLETAVRERVGATGATGRDGATGAQGIPGRDGKDSNVQGPRGQYGRRGERGEKGDRGAIGEQGTKGIQGERGEQGAAGKDGLKGEKGERGDVTIVGDVELREAVVVLKKRQARWLAAVLKQFELNTGRTHPGLKAAINAVLRSIEQDSKVE